MPRASVCCVYLSQFDLGSRMGCREQTGVVLRLIERTLTLMSGVVDETPAMRVTRERESYEAMRKAREEAIESEDEDSPLVTSFMGKESQYQKTHNESKSDPGIYQKMVDLYEKMIKKAGGTMGNFRSVDMSKVVETRNEYAREYVALKYAALHVKKNITEADFDATFRSIFPMPNRKHFHDELMKRPIYSEKDMGLITLYIEELSEGFQSICEMQPGLFDTSLVDGWNSIETGLGERSQTRLEVLIPNLKKLRAGVAAVNRNNTYTETYEYMGLIERHLVNLKNLVLAKEASVDDLKKKYFSKHWTLDVHENASRDKSIMVHFRNITDQSIFKFGPSVNYTPEKYPFTSKAPCDPVKDVGADNYFHSRFSCNVYEAYRPQRDGVQFSVRVSGRSIGFYSQ